MRRMITALFTLLAAAAMFPALAHAQCDVDGCPEIYPTLRYGFGTHIDKRSDYSFSEYDPKLGTTVYYYGAALGDAKDAECLHVFFDVRNCGQAIGKMVIALQDTDLCKDRILTVRDYKDPNHTVDLATFPSSAPFPVTYTPSPAIQPFDTGTIRVGFCVLCGCHRGTMKIKVTLLKPDGVTPVCPHPVVFAFNLQGCTEDGVSTGYSASDAATMAVSPNPATNTLTITSPATVNGASLRLVAADGHDALSIPIRSTSEPLSTQLDIRSIPSGTYMVVLDGLIGGQHNIITQKIIIMKP
jgi:hypothetical protein